MERYINKFVSMPKHNPPSLAAERAKEEKTRAEEPFEKRHREKKRQRGGRERNRKEIEEKPKQKKVVNTSPRPPAKVRVYPSPCTSPPL